MFSLRSYGVNWMKSGRSARNSYLRDVKNNGNGIRSFCQKDENNSACVPFLDMISERRAQAAKSILVQVQSEKSFRQLYTYCESLGPVKNMYHFSEGTDPMHFMIVEFESESDVGNVLKSGSFLRETQTIPATSQFLWFRATSKKLGKLKANRQCMLSVENGTKVISEEELRRALSKCSSVSDQIEQLYKLTRLNDIGQRLRFLTAKQVESTVSGLFPLVCAYPFGSSVNGFGKMGCDLDINMRLTLEVEKEDSRLIYHCKASAGSERSTNQRNMETIGDLINLFLPGCSQVRRILQARVPIIKYYQQLTNVECDLSMSNMSGVYMSDFLYVMGEIDPRVRPLIFAIRKWAQQVYLTNPTPGRWITNFSLTLLALSFLQKPLRSPPILPTLNELTKLAEPNDRYVTEDGINGTFLRDITKLKSKTKNQSSLESLLLEFFEYYAQFDFSSKAVCLNEAVSIVKPEHSPLYIVNPLERGLNVSKNMSLEEVEKLKIEIRNAAWILEEKKSGSGLLALFESPVDMKSKLNFAFSQKHNRLMDVSALFNENNAREEIDFKNPTVEKEVEKIKKDTKQNIKAMEMRHRRQKSGR